jgi:hypothetical protein
MLARKIQVPVSRPHLRDGSCDINILQFSEVIVLAGQRLWIATRDHRTTPEVQNFLAMLIARLNLEYNEASRRTTWLAVGLSKSRYTRRSAQSVSDVHRSKEDQSAIEEIGLYSL